MSLLSELQACLRELAAAGAVELRENGARITSLSTLSWELRGKEEKPLLHLWSEQHNLTRRVLAITDHSDERLALAVQCFGRTKPDRLEFRRVEFERSERELDRDAFAQSIARLCRNEFPDDKLESLTSSPDLEHSLSGNYARGVLRRGRETWALFAVPEQENGDDPARHLTFALLWLDRLRHSASVAKTAAGLRILLPAGLAAPVAHLLPALHPEVRVQLFERDPVMERLQRIEPSAVANFISSIVPAREAESLLQRSRRDLAPLLPETRNALSFQPNVAGKEVVVRFRGLACLLWQESGVHFGPRDFRRKLEADNAASLAKMFADLELYRNPLASDTRHALYRAQPERWLEFLVRQDVTRIDSTLDARFAYGQVMASSGGEHGILDVLGATRSGRLAVIELKCVEHPVLVLQAAKYWLRVRRHLEQGDFPRYGYFPGVALQAAAPIVFLVAPAMHFHPATDAILRYLNPEIEIIRVGLAESWRRGVCVVLRQ